MFRKSELLVALSIIGMVCLLLIPISPFLLDILLVVSLLLSVMTLLLTLYIEDPLEFSLFPNVILFVTVYRLALNIASTRMILTRQVGGHVIQTFGEVVTSHSSFVGLLLFSLLTVINFVMVSKGAGRIAEVTARFTLEALSGKQMAIDNEVNAGLLSNEEARKMRETVSAESDFYGAMDGASKFVRGDAICSCIIIVVNLFGGFVVGVLGQGLPIAECWQTMSRLTIGDGLINQVPALLISVAAAMMVTRVSKASLGTLLPKQFLTHPKVMLVTAIFAFILSFIPGMPLTVLWPITAVLFWYAHTLFKNEQTREKKTEISKEEEPFVYPITLELSVGLRPLAKLIQEKIPNIRRHITTHLGLALPSIHIIDNLELSEKQYLIKIRETTIFYGTAIGLEDLTEQLQMSLKKHIASLLTRQELARMIERAKVHNEAVIKELIPIKITLGQLLKVLQNLLKEKVSIRDFITILEAIADHLCIERTVDVEVITEKVRQGLSTVLAQTFIGKEKIAHAITIDAKVQQMIKHSGPLTPLRPSSMTKMNNEILRLTDLARERSLSPIVVTASFARVAVKQMIESHLPDLPVLAFEELSPEIKIESLGKITTDILV